MVASSDSRVRASRYRIGNVSPSAAAERELRWFFNEAASEVDEPSNFAGLLAGMSATSLEAVERRAEAVHAAAKIRGRLQAVSGTDARMLEALFTERPWPARLERRLGVLAGPVVALPVVKAEHLRALMGARTRQKMLAGWLEDLLKADRDALAPWLPEAALACSMAIGAYEGVRGRGPSVVPEDGDDCEKEVG
jgi:hypothetical protein